MAAKQNDSWALAGPGEEQQQQGQSRFCAKISSANQNALLCRTQLMIEEEERIGQLEQREQSMRQLESDIVDVNTIFKVKLGVGVYGWVLIMFLWLGSCNNGA